MSHKRLQYGIPYTEGTEGPPRTSKATLTKTKQSLQIRKSLPTFQSTTPTSIYLTAPPNRKKLGTAYRVFFSSRQTARQFRQFDCSLGKQENKHRGHNSLDVDKKKKVHVSPGEQKKRKNDFVRSSVTQGDQLQQQSWSSSAVAPNYSRQEQGGKKTHVRPYVNRKKHVHHHAARRRPAIWADLNTFVFPHVSSASLRQSVSSERTTSSTAKKRHPTRRSDYKAPVTADRRRSSLPNATTTHAPCTTRAFADRSVHTPSRSLNPSQTPFPANASYGDGSRKRMIAYTPPRSVKSAFRLLQRRVPTYARAPPSQSRSLHRSTSPPLPCPTALLNLRHP